MQETQVQSLIQEDPTYLKATKPVHHNYWACALEPRNHNYELMCYNFWSLRALDPVLWNRRWHCNEKPAHHN